MKPKMNSLVIAPNEQPKRPLSAYNIFFQVERQRLISAEPVEGPYTDAEVFGARLEKTSDETKRPHRKMHGKITFVDLAKTISLKWKELETSQKRLFEERAENMKRKYAVELEDWLMMQVPTPKIKKRIGALRRGSMSKYLKHSHRKRTSTTTTNTVYKPTPEASHNISAAAVPPPPLPTSCIRRSSPTPSYATCHSDYDNYTRSPPPRQVSPLIPPERRKLQMERAQNLRRLYQMQIELYQEQLRLHAECKAEQENFAMAISGPPLEPVGYPEAPSHKGESLYYHPHDNNNENYPSPHSAAGFHKLVPKHPQPHEDAFPPFTAADYTDSDYYATDMQEDFQLDLPPPSFTLNDPMDFHAIPPSPLHDEERAQLVPIDPFADE